MCAHSQTTMCIIYKIKNVCLNIFTYCDRQYDFEIFLNRSRVKRFKLGKSVYKWRNYFLEVSAKESGRLYSNHDYLVLLVTEKNR